MSARAAQTRAYWCLLLISMFLSGSPARGDDQATKEPVKLFPACKIHSHEDYYPEPARRLHAQGRFVVEFLVDDRGRPEHVSIAESPAKIFSASAFRLVSSLRCTLPEDWWSRGGANHRFRLGIYYFLADCKLSERLCVAPHMQVTDTDIDDFITVTGSAPRR